MVSGPTSSGKTYLVRDILKYHKSIIMFKNSNVETITVLWAHGQDQELYKQSIDNVKCTYFDGLPNDEDISDVKPDIIIIDDLMSELCNNKKLANLFTKGSHHNNISVIFISQNVFQQGSQMRTISLNCHYLILMKNPRDAAQIMRLASQIYPTKIKGFMEAYGDATETEFGYIRIDLKQNTPQKFRLQTDIIPNSSGQMQPFVYILK